jgi:hypothetical protein
MQQSFSRIQLMILSNVSFGKVKSKNKDLKFQTIRTPNN